MNIPNFPNYIIERDGTIMNTKTNQILIHSIGNGKRRYKVVNLCRNGKRYTCYIHRLLAECYIPREVGKDTVDHIDRNKLNNDLSNLRWVNKSENEINKPVKDEEMRNIVKNKNSYTVRMKRQGRMIYIGSAKTLEEAKMLRNLHILPEK